MISQARDRSATTFKAASLCQPIGTIFYHSSTNPGTGYIAAPVVNVASAPFAPELAVEVRKIRVRMNVVLGLNYQLESSNDLKTWVTAGDPFVAQDEQLAQDLDVDTTGRFFRVRQVP